MTRRSPDQNAGDGWTGARKQGLRSKLAVDDNGVEGWTIHDGPIKQSFVDRAGLDFVDCIHVHGYEQAWGNFQKCGMGKALIAAAEKDERQLGATGMAAWGVWLPFWTNASSSICLSNS